MNTSGRDEAFEMMEARQSFSGFETLKPVERRYLLGSGSCKLLYRRFQRQTLVSKCVVILVHGFGEHVGRFSHVIEMLIDSACDVHSIDLRGHGLSGGPRADGFFVDFVNDIGILHRVASEASPTLPLFLYGQSMGGMLVLAYAIRRTNANIRGVISTSPWLRLSEDVQLVWWKDLLLRVVGNFFQEFLISSNVDPCSLSNVENVVNATIHDRLVLPFMTVRMAKQIIAGARETLRRAEDMRVPVLLVHGGKDTLTSFQATLEFGRRLRSTDKTVRIYRGAFHEIHNDIDREQLFAEVKDWIGQRCNVQPSLSCTSLSTQAEPVRVLRLGIFRRIFSLRGLLLLLVYVLLALRHHRRRPLLAVLWPLQYLPRIFHTFIPL